MVRTCASSQDVTTTAPVFDVSSYQRVVGCRSRYLAPAGRIRALSCLLLHQALAQDKFATSYDRSISTTRHLKRLKTRAENSL